MPRTRGNQYPCSVCRWSYPDNITAQAWIHGPAKMASLCRSLKISFAAQLSPHVHIFTIASDHLSGLPLAACGSAARCAIFLILPLISTHTILILNDAPLDVAPSVRTRLPTARALDPPQPRSFDHLLEPRLAAYIPVALGPFADDVPSAVPPRGRRYDYSRSIVFCMTLWDYLFLLFAVVQRSEYAPTLQHVQPLASDCTQVDKYPLCYICIGRILVPKGERRPAVAAEMALTVGSVSGAEHAANRRVRLVGVEGVSCGLDCCQWRAEEGRDRG